MYCRHLFFSKFCVCKCNFPERSIEEIVIPPGTDYSTFIKEKLLADVWTHFWSFCSVPFAYMSTSTWAPCCFGYTSTIACLGILLWCFHLWFYSHSLIWFIRVIPVSIWILGLCFLVLRNMSQDFDYYYTECMCWFRQYGHFETSLLATRDHGSQYSQVFEINTNICFTQVREWRLRDIR